MNDKNNKLDDFLRQQLNDSSEDHSWNVPDDSLFEKAVRTVHAEKKKKRRGWILIPFILGAILIGSEYVHNGQIKTLQGKLTHLEECFLTQSPGATSSLPSSQNTISAVSAFDVLSSDDTRNIEVTLKNNSATINKQTPGYTSETIRLREYSQSNKYAAIGNNSEAATASFNVTTYREADSNPKDVVEGGISLQASSGWITFPLGISLTKVVQNDKALILAPQLHPGFHQKPVVQTGSTYRYGLLLNTNQSWLTMKNIPIVKDAKLSAYDNSQAGIGAYGFAEKSLSSKFSLQTGFGFSVYQNKSVLENQFLFDMDKVVLTPDGQSIYQTDIDLINPLGDYSTMLDFRVSDQMHQNDIIVENTKIMQTLSVLYLDLGVNYKLIKGKHIDVSMGTGIILGRRSGLKNEFSVSSYHNDILQDNQIEIPDHMNNVRRWYGQAMGKLTLEYHVSDRFGFIIDSQYNRGLTSLRNGSPANGPQTYLHAFILSAGATHNF